MPDAESNGAAWVTLEEFSNLKKIRGDELLEYGKHIEEGKPILPLSILRLSRKV